MEQDFFTNLPSDITINILSRLPIRTTMSCKCVCKPWLGVLTTPEFVKAHLSKSAPGLAVFNRGTQSKHFKIVEFVDEADPTCDEHPWKTVFNFVSPDLPFNEPLHSSANGLVFLCIQANTGSDCGGDLVLCNPITREYIKLPSPRKTYSKPMLHLDTYGFGVSKMSGQYKVVRIFLDEKLPVPRSFKADGFKCQVYNVGTGSWRNIASPKKLMYVDCEGAILNGNLHFLALKRRSYLISCLDLETELFSSFSAPPLHDPHKCRYLSVLRDCICVCENSADELMSAFEIDIWLMKDYGDVKSWAKEFVIRKVYKEVFIGFLCPIKVFEGGDILMELGRKKLLFYSSKNETIREVDLCGLGSSTLRSTTIYTPSLLPLKTCHGERELVLIRDYLAFWC